MKAIMAFFKYVIDQRKLKSLFLLFQVFALLMIVGCRNQQDYDQTKYEAQKADLISIYETEIQQLKAQAESNIYATQYLSSQYKSDAWTLAQWLDCLDARFNLTTEAKNLACWVVINRMESSDYPNDIENVLKQPEQFCEFSDAEPPTESNIVIASNQLSRYYNGDIRPVPSRAVFITVNSDGVVLRDTWEENRNTGYWRA